MLAKEKKRAGWSLAVGAVISVIAFAGWQYWAYWEEAQLPNLIQTCNTRAKSERASGPNPPPDHDSLVCDPEQLKEIHYLTDDQWKIRLLLEAVNAAHQNARIYAAGAFIGSCLPFVWYFLNVSRGFRRLSVFVAILAGLFVCFLRIMYWDYEWQPRDYAVAATIIAAPPLLALLLGWVVAGFRDSN